MRDSLHHRPVFAVILYGLIVLSAGCSVGVRPSPYYDVPPADDTYNGQSYESYYRIYDYSPPPIYYDSGYDPWTMNMYYDGYAGSPRADRGSGSSTTGGALSEDKHPAAKDRDVTYSRQSRAPSNEESRVRRNRAAVLEIEKVKPEPDSSSITSQKVRRNTKRESPQASDGVKTKKKEEVKSEAQKTQREPVKSESEEDKEKKEKGAQTN